MGKWVWDQNKPFTRANQTQEMVKPFTRTNWVSIYQGKQKWGEMVSTCRSGKPFTRAKWISICQGKPFWVHPKKIGEVGAKWVWGEIGMGYGVSKWVTSKTTRDWTEGFSVHVSSYRWDKPFWVHLILTHSQICAQSQLQADKCGANTGTQNGVQTSFGLQLVYLTRNGYGSNLHHQELDRKF